MGLASLERQLLELEVPMLGWAVADSGGARGRQAPLTLLMSAHVPVMVWSAQRMASQRTLSLLAPQALEATFPGSVVMVPSQQAARSLAQSLVAAAHEADCACDDLPELAGALRCAAAPVPVLAH